MIIDNVKNRLKEFLKKKVNSLYNYDNFKEEQKYLANEIENLKKEINKKNLIAQEVPVQELSSLRKNCSAITYQERDQIIDDILRLLSSNGLPLNLNRMILHDCIDELDGKSFIIF